MKVWTRLEHYQPDPKRPLILALGNFDGVHLGHQEIIRLVLERAQKRKGTPAVLTFFDHPQRVLHHAKEPGLLTSPQHRLFLFQNLGIEICFLLRFTLSFSKTSAETFVEEFLIKRLAVKEIHLGYNAHFGFGRGGDCELMRKLAKRFGFEFHEMEPVKQGGGFISSSLIRQAIKEGDLERAGRLLGRPFSITAQVIRGRGRGKSLGFPTANLKPHSEILPPRGVYPAEVREHSFLLKPFLPKNGFLYEAKEPGKWMQGILNLGSRPTFGNGGIEIPEVFLFDFNGNLYRKTVEVVFHPKLRDEKKFRNTEELRQAIEEDVSRAKKYFHRISLQSL